MERAAKRLRASSPDLWGNDDSFSLEYMRHVNLDYPRGTPLSGDVLPIEPDVDEFMAQFGGSQPEPLDFNQLFTLELKSEKKNAEFQTTRFKYDVKVATLPRILDNAVSIAVLPDIFAAILGKCTEGFLPNDQLLIELECQDLNPNIYLHVRKFGNFEINVLIDQVKALNSQKRFKVDETFKIKIIKIRRPSGGGARRTHAHTTIDRNRMAKSLVTVKVSRNLCLPTALFLGHYRLVNDVTGEGKAAWDNLNNKGRTAALERKVVAVLSRCGFQIGQKFGLDDLDRLQRMIYSKFQIVVVSQAHCNSVIYRSPPVKLSGMKEIVVYYQKDHFDLITTMTGFLMCQYYCTICDKGYAVAGQHLCEGTCKSCYRPNSLCVLDKWVDCEHCQRRFRNATCFNLHRNNSHCTNIFVCKKCDAFVNFLRRKKDKRVHKCGEIFCKVCSEFIDPSTHKCYLKRLEPKEIKAPNYIFFDFETWNHPELGLIPNAVVAQYSDGTEFRFPKDGELMTEDVTEQFGRWLFHERHEGYTIIAHNFRSFDGHFILKYMLDNNLRPDVIKRGTQLLDLQYAKLDIKARDTLNFCALKLADFPKAVGLKDIARKGEFPHHINRTENVDKIIPFAKAEEYGLDGRTAEEKEKLLLWHAVEERENSGLFDFRKQLMDYCSNDVTVTRLCGLEFRRDFIDLCIRLFPSQLPLPLNVSTKPTC